MEIDGGDAYRSKYGYWSKTEDREIMNCPTSIWGCSPKCALCVLCDNGTIIILCGCVPVRYQIVPTPEEAGKEAK